MQDFIRIQEDPVEGVSGAPIENNIMIWNGVIFGPRETPFEDGTFKLKVWQVIHNWSQQQFLICICNLQMEFCENYPLRPPRIKFLSRMFHPNINAHGEVFLDILKNK